jgi:MazG family protein
LKAFDELLEVAKRLNAKDGCPWDIKQTFFSLQPYVLEEAHELVEAVDGGDSQEILEELGDLLYTVVFYAKIAERENQFTMEEILTCIKEKLIRRHPHIFGDVKAETSEEVVKNWDEIKKAESGKEHRKTPLDGIPDNLPILSKAQKMLKVFKKEGFVSLKEVEEKKEEEIADAFFSLLKTAERSGIDLEGALRRKVMEEKKLFLEKVKV